MKKYLLIGVLLLLTGLVGAIYCVETINDNKNGVTNKYNLALRQIAHKIYLLNNDEDSQIDPVIENSALSYSIKIKTALHYDTLPYLINKAVEDFELPKKYTVSINSCEDEKTVLGYSSIAFESKQMACSSREHNLDCSLINIDFELPKQNNTMLWLLTLASMLLGIFYILKAFRKSKTDKSLILEHKITQSKVINTENHTLKIGQYDFDPKNLSLTINGKSQTLTFRENKLLSYLSLNKNEVISRENILQNVWEDEGVIVGRSLDVFISRLRKLLKEDENISIKSIHGVGYRFNVTPPS